MIRPGLAGGPQNVSEDSRTLELLKTQREQLQDSMSELETLLNRTKRGSRRNRKLRSELRVQRSLKEIADRTIRKEERRLGLVSAPVEVKPRLINTERGYVCATELEMPVVSFFNG